MLFPSGTPQIRRPLSQVCRLSPSADLVSRSLLVCDSNSARCFAVGSYNVCNSYGKGQRNVRRDHLRAGRTLAAHGAMMLAVLSRALRIPLGGAQLSINDGSPYSSQISTDKDGAERSDNSAAFDASRVIQTRPMRTRCECSALVPLESPSSPALAGTDRRRHFVEYCAG